MRQVAVSDVWGIPIYVTQAEGALWIVAAPVLVSEPATMIRLCGLHEDDIQTAPSDGGEAR